MTNVIAFRPDNTRLLPRRRDAGAEILFFTGVRYVRDTDEVAPVAPAPAKRTAKRRPRAEVRRDASTERLQA